MDDECKASKTEQLFACGLCGESTDSPWFCRNCIKPLCENCYRSHLKNTISKNHLVVKKSLEMLRSSIIAVPCVLHPSKEVSAYCNTCSKPCCISCLVENHQSHAFSTIEEKYMAVQKSLYGYIEQVQQMMKQIDDTSHRLSLTKRMNTEVKKEVKEWNERLNQAVDKSSNFLLYVLETSDSGLGYVKRQISDEKNKIEKLIRAIDRKISVGKFGIIKYTPPPIPSLLSEIKMPFHKIPCFLPNMKLVTQIEPMIGILSFYEIEITKVKSFTLTMHVKSITAAQNSSAWVTRNKNDTIHLLTKTGELTQSLEVRGCKALNDVAINKLGEIIVTCADCKVRYLDRQGVVSRLIDSGPFEPEGVCLTEREEVVVCMSGHDKKNHLAVYSPDGRSKVRESKGVDSQGIPQITSPYRLVCNGKDLCVVNKGRNVVSVNECDDARWVYSGKQVKLGKSFGPNAICVDKYNNLLITDLFNACVHYVDRKGGLIQVILTEQQTGLWDLRGICVQQESEVWIVSLGGEVVICKYLK